MITKDTWTRNRIMKASLQRAAFLAFLGLTAASYGPFSATLYAPSVQEVGNEVTCQVVITNNHNADYYLLKRDTPLDDLTSHMFLVKNNENYDVNYDGFFFKLAKPTADDYVRVLGHSSVASTVVLSKAYSFYDPSIYSMKLHTQLLYTDSPYSAPLSQYLTSNTRHMFLLSSDQEPLWTEPENLRRKQALLQDISDSYFPAYAQAGYKSPTFAGAWPDDQKIATETAYNLAYSAAPESVKDITERPPLYKQWFGESSSTRQDKVKGVYNSITDAMNNHAYELDYYGDHCKPSEKKKFAYTAFDWRTIVFCYAYFHAKDTGCDSKAGTIIHEMSHSAGHTVDVPGYYGANQCEKLAKNDPDTAVTNADNYEYFSETGAFGPC